MNILVIGTEKSIHDLKWISFLAQHSEHRFFFVSERPNKADGEYEEKYKSAGIELLDPLPPFSLSSVLSTIKGFRYLHAIIRVHKIDFVHVIFPTPHLYWMLFSKLPTIVSTRGSDVLVVIKSLIEGGGFKEKILLFLMKKNLIKTRAITCTSELQADFLRSHFPFLTNKISIVRTGIDIGFIERIQSINQTERDKKTIFSPRFFSPIYNILGQIKALKQLPGELQKNISVVFVRGKVYNKTYESQVLEALSQAKFLYEIIPYLTQEEMVRQYKEADVVIMTPFSDGTPNSALEAMAARKPLVISDLPYNSPLFDETCLKANPADENDIAKQVEIALTAYPQTYIEKGYRMVTLHGNQQTEMNKIIKLYQEIGEAKG